MVMWQDPELQKAWEEQAKKDAGVTPADNTQSQSPQTPNTTQQQAQIEALQWGQSGSSAPPTPTSEPIYTNPTPNQPVISPSGQEAAHERASKLDSKIQQENIQSAQKEYEAANNELTQVTEEFNQRWDSKIRDGAFIGTDAEYQQYIKEAGNLQGKNKQVEILVGKLNKTIEHTNQTNEKEQKRFQDKNTQLSDGKYISNLELVRIMQESPAMHQIIMEKGITGAENFIKDYNETSGENKFKMLKDKGFIDSDSRYVGEDEQGNPLFLSGAQASTMDALKKYSDSPALALSKNAVTTKQLKEIGYSDEEIQRFVDAVAESRSSKVALPGESGFKQQWNREYQKAEDAFNKAADKIEQENPKASKEEIASLLVNTPEYQALQEINEQVPDPMGTEFAIARRALISGSSTFVFSPARSLLPEVKVSDISGMEWAIGGAQVALLTVPVLGIAAKGATGGVALAIREVEFGVQAGAAALFTKETIDNWDYLKENPWQAGLAIAMDALIIGSAAGSLSRVATTARAQQIANIEARARKIVVDKFMDSATGRIDPRVKKTFTRIPTAPLEPGQYLPVKSELRVPSLKTTMAETARAIRTGNRQLLIDSGKRLQYLALKDPNSPMAKLMYSRGKELEENADDWINLSKKKIPAKERQALDDAIKANQSKADEIERALKRGIKNPETKHIAEETLRETRRQLKTQIKEATQPLPKEKVIMPAEQGKQVPAIKKGTELTTKEKKRPTLKPSEDSRIKPTPSRGADVQVTIRAGEGGEVYVGYVSFPTSDPESQRKYLESLKNTYTRQGYVVEVSPDESIVSSTMPETKTPEVISPVPKISPGSSPDKKTKPLPVPSIKLTPEPEPLPEPSPKPVPKDVPDEATAPEPDDVPEPATPPEKPVITVPPPPVYTTNDEPDGSEKYKTKHGPILSKTRPSPAQIGKATSSWPQGMGWWVVYRGSDGNLYKWFSHGQRPPKGVRNVRQGEGEAARGIQQPAGNLTEEYDFPMGVTSARITKPGKTPGRAGAIAFLPASRTRLPGSRTRITPSARKRRR